MTDNHVTDSEKSADAARAKGVDGKRAVGSAKPTLRGAAGTGAGTGTMPKRKPSRPMNTVEVVKKRKIVGAKPLALKPRTKTLVSKKILEVKGDGDANKPKRRVPLSNAPAAGGLVLRPMSPKQRQDAVLRKEQKVKEAAARAAAKEQEDKEAKKVQAVKQATPKADNLRQQKRAEEQMQKTAEAAPAEKKKTPRTRPTLRNEEGKKREKKLTIVNYDDEVKVKSLAALRRRIIKRRPKQPKETQAITREVVIPETIEVTDLAARMAARISDVVKFLFKQGFETKADDMIDADTAELVVEEFGHKVRRVAASDVEEAIDDTKDKAEDLKPRAPVVTIMGHVDHGKTSLLDALRSTAIAEKEAGGITQHIGAYQTEFGDKGKITFIDTPGHEAFTSMRARGAKTTDLVVLVIAADDSVMPQTIESINHAKAANTPILVALNKMDLPGADENKIQQQLLQYDLVCESMGGDVQAIPISAKTGTGLDALMESITLQADMMELQANPDRPPQGLVIEARLDKGEGHVATVLVQRGTLKKGDIFVVGTEWGRVRRMKAFDGTDLKEAPPSCPVSVNGLNGPALAGDSFDCVESESRAKEIAEYRRKQKQEAGQKTNGGKSIEELMLDVQAKGKPTLYYIVKSDVQGSSDAIKQALMGLSDEEIEVKVSHAGVGEASTSDVRLAETIGAKILIFNSKAASDAQIAARQAKITLYQFNIIYALLDEVKTQIAAHLGPQRKETPLGKAEILQLFSVGKKNVAAGCRVRDGQMKRNAFIRIKREDVIIHEGLIQSLRHFKENVATIDSGKECGIVFDSLSKFQEGDIIECFQVEQVERTVV